MAAPLVYTWLPIAVSPALGQAAQFFPYIAPVQAVGLAGGLLNINGNPESSYGPYVFDKIMRSIQIASTLDLSNLTITISGIGAIPDANKNPGLIGPITENLLGPDASLVDIAFVESVNIYSQINSISVSGQAANISVGFGYFGITDYAYLDTNKTIFQSAMQVQFINIPNTALSTVSLFGSLTKNERVLPNGNIMSNVPIPAFSAIDGSFTILKPKINTLVSIFQPMSMVWTAIQQDSTAQSETIKVTVLQQGQR